MNWRDFHEKYIVEAETKSTVDVSFDNNTPIVPSGSVRIERITQARVLSRETMKVVKSYSMELQSEEIRSTHNELRALLIRDFQIVEVVALTSYQSKTQNRALA